MAMFWDTRVNTAQPHDVPLLFPVSVSVGGEHADRRLLSVRIGNEEAERMGASSTWFASSGGRVVLVYETKADPDLIKAGLAAARFCQQKFWEQTGIHTTLVSDRFLHSKKGRRWLKLQNTLVVFGALAY